MGKLRILSGKEVCQILEKHGFVETRKRGSHIAMQRKTNESTLFLSPQAFSLKPCISFHHSFITFRLQPFTFNLSQSLN